MIQSCAKVGYLFDQGRGQLSLLMDGIPNEEILSNPVVKEKHKEKIRQIEAYKKYFYKYFSMEPGEIYTETVFLKRDAVTYLVIASPFNTIKAKKECFPFMGCFPYLGFFDEKKAQKHTRELEEKDYVTYVRKVKAYSTLGYFDDNILSTFFTYKEQQLAELIFHELFHTLFFVKGEVELNENLAMFFSEEMLADYFSWGEKEKSLWENERKVSRIVKKYIVSQVKNLQNQYDRLKPQTKSEADAILDTFLKNDFKAGALKICSIHGLRSCSFAKKPWNNASFSAFLTYENKGEKIRRLYSSLNMSLVDFYKYIRDKYKEYKKVGSKESFTAYLLG